jgi:hypothetical protein
MFQLTYLNVGSGSTPPTQAQAANVNSVKVAVYPASSADTQLNLTHNLQMSSADLADGWPNIGFEPLDALAAASGWFQVQGAQNPNYSVVQRGTATTAGVDTTNQLYINIQRPHTIVR